MLRYNLLSFWDLLHHGAQMHWTHRLQILKGPAMLLYTTKLLCSRPIYYVKNLPNWLCALRLQYAVYRQSAPIIAVRAGPTTSPARCIPQGIASNDVPIIVFHIANLKV